MAKDENAVQYWMQAEQFKRKLLGRKLPNAYYEERDGIEKERALMDKWKQAGLEKVKVSRVFKMNWEKKKQSLK